MMRTLRGVCRPPDAATTPQRGWRRAIARTVRTIGGCGLLALSLSSCATLSKKEQGAMIGGTAGGVVGGVVGKQTGSTTWGAIIGAAVGGATGAVIGHQMDQQAKELKTAIPGATVARVGEGIALTFESGVLYDFDSDVVRADAAQHLRDLAANVDKYPNTDLLIVGHTDATGTSSYNQWLSQRRATAALNFLVERGVNPARLRAVGRGETEPVASNATDAGQQANRRVEIAVVANASARVP